MCFYAINIRAIIKLLIYIYYIGMTVHLLITGRDMYDFDWIKFWYKPGLKNNEIRQILYLPLAATSVQSSIPESALQKEKNVVVRFVCFCLPWILHTGMSKHKYNIYIFREATKISTANRITLCILCPFVYL